ncbi:hypothetical protein B296_00015110 [Ensete ventricosum]|uniref:Uncharacterized protein n=1 Tax=Ensete ventricosum TaxID=4639 RepID=A0A426Y676_ENSVE|nr:hypothetical protein B296_00015110 [Ensete ventricosum]
MILYLQKLYLFVYRDKLFLKCHIQLNQLWALMQYSLISGYFHDFTEEWTMMLKVFRNDDLRSTAHDRKKEQKKGIHMTPTIMMSSISMLALPERGNVFVLGANTSRVGIDLIRRVSHLKWKFKEDDSAQILPTNTPADEEAKVQVIIV